MTMAAGTYVGVTSYSGTDPPFSVIQSKSMQHSDDESALGILDTGDMVLVRDPSKVRIQSYVEGRLHGHSSFGEYGDVIIYKRPNNTPVIHRAMLWLDNNGDGTWTAKALENYPPELWSNPGGWDSLHGILTLHDVGYGHASVSVHLTDSLGARGFLTKGDNAVTNPVFDQAGGIFPRLVAVEDIKSVPGMEIPWLGCIKMLINETNLEQIPGNSLPSLMLFFLVLFSMVPATTVVFQSLFDLVNRKEKIHGNSAEERGRNPPENNN